MGNKDSRSGGKYTGNHTTLIPAAALMCDVAHQSTSVTKISPGYIKAGLPTVGGQRRIKIIDEGGALRLTIRDNVSQQEVYLYTDDKKRTIAALKKGAAAHNLKVSFGKSNE